MGYCSAVEWIRRWIDRLSDRAEAQGLPWLAWSAKAIELTLEIGRQLVSDQALRTAASLAFTTILSMVPVLAVSFAALRALVPDEAVAAEIRVWLLDTVLADSVSGVAQYLERFLAETQGHAVGVVGLTVLVVTSVALFLSVERAVNAVWRVPPSRPLYRRLITFYAVITLTPALIGLGTAAGAWILEALATPSLGAALGSIVSALLVMLALTLMYKLLPHTNVRWSVALAGALWGATVLQLSRFVFNFFVGTIYAGSISSKIYGAFALIPLFFIWVYLTWIIVLGGVTLAYMLQHRTVLTRALLRRRGRTGGIPAAPTGYLVARVFFTIARHFRAQGGGLAPEAIAAHLQIDGQELKAPIRLLRDGGLLLQVNEGDGHDLVPSRALDKVDLTSLYALVEADGYRPGELPADQDDALERLLGEVEAERRRRMRTSVDELLD
jgi:membrane protein